MNERDAVAEMFKTWPDQEAASMAARDMVAAMIPGANITNPVAYVRKLLESATKIRAYERAAAASAAAAEAERDADLERVHKLQEDDADGRLTWDGLDNEQQSALFTSAVDLLPMATGRSAAREAGPFGVRTWPRIKTLMREQT